MGTGMVTVTVTVTTGSITRTKMRSMPRRESMMRTRREKRRSRATKGREVSPVGAEMEEGGGAWRLFYILNIVSIKLFISLLLR
mmetsp:Transcript_8476/g.28422  ORF Transcript_8476/g.28422 Transcript_8476/m.28422 type:complete len:84 (+) Transcript_8476:953-1204(+)